MFASERSYIESIPGLAEDPALLEAVVSAVEDLFSIRRAAVLEVVSDPAHKQTLIDHGVDETNKRLVELGVDPTQTGEDGRTIAEAISSDNAATISSAVMAHLLSLLYNTQ